jgi:hypothetical protein
LLSISSMSLIFTPRCRAFSSNSFMYGAEKS